MEGECKAGITISTDLWAKARRKTGWTMLRLDCEKLQDLAPSIYNHSSLISRKGG